MQTIGLSFQQAQLNWAARERHNVGGNGMRRGSTSELILDDNWRYQLTLLQKLPLTWELFLAAIQRFWANDLLSVR